MVYKGPLMPQTRCLGFSGKQFFLEYSRYEKKSQASVNPLICCPYFATEPIHRLEGHTGAVCSLIAGKFGTLLSGSWDK